MASESEKSESRKFGLGGSRGLSFCAAIFAAGILVYLSRVFLFPIDDPDVFWHVVIGRWILSHGALPTTEHWNAFGLGHGFRAYSWMSEISYAATEGAFGLRGLRAFQCVLALMLLGCCFYVWKRLSGSKILACLGLMLLIQVLDPFVSPRPQVLTFILFSLIPLIADSVRRRGVSPWNLTASAALMSVWANNHVAMILGLGYLGGLLFAFEKKRALECMKILAAGFAGTLCNPYFLGAWKTFLFTSGDLVIFKNSIVEFEALSPSHFMFPLWLLCLLFFIFLLVFIGRRRLCARENIFEILVTASFLALGCYAVKFLVFSTLASLAFFMRHFPEVFRESLKPWIEKKMPRAIEKAKEIFSSGAAQSVILISGLLLLASAAMDLSVRQAEAPLIQDVYSEAALDFVFANRLPEPVLTDFSNGGYLMYRLSDKNGDVRSPVAIDGRTYILSDEESKSYYRMENVQDGWRDFIESYKPGTIVWPTARNSGLAEALAESDEWCLRLSGGEGGRGYSVFTRCAIQPPTGGREPGEGKSPVNE